MYGEWEFGSLEEQVQEYKDIALGHGLCVKKKHKIVLQCSLPNDTFTFQKYRHSTMSLHTCKLPFPLIVAYEENATWIRINVATACSIHFWNCTSFTQKKNVGRSSYSSTFRCFQSLKVGKDVPQLECLVQATPGRIISMHVREQTCAKGDEEGKMAHSKRVQSTWIY